MERSILNSCWEFCHEVIVADPKNNNSTILVLNLPKRFVDILETRLIQAGFSCVSFKPHGLESALVKFRKNIEKSELAID